VKFLLKKFFPDANARAIHALVPVLERINAQESEIETLSDTGLLEKGAHMRKRAQSGVALADMIIEAFPLVREAGKRTLKQRAFDVQIMGGIVLAQGKIAEMKTGEGKTLAATFPAYVHSLFGKGVHVVTVNDYLAQRDTVWMGQIYHALGVSVACLVHDHAFSYDPDYQESIKPKSQERADDRARDTEGGFKIFHEYLRPISRREAYAADITYGTNNEFGFDYLRDNLVYAVEEKVQRPCAFAIIDEVDSILIDESRTPLIISAPDQDAGKLYREFSKLVPRLNKETDYTIDEKHKLVSLTEQGIERMSELLGRNVYEENNLILVHHLEEALKANLLFQRDRDYVVKDGGVIIVDEFTGRLMFGRRYSGGLHQALEAKEKVRIQEESRTYATITIQNYFRMYPILSGMTGTAITSAEEFHKVYGLDVIAIPTNKPMIRIGLPDKIFLTEQGKFKALVQEIKERHEKGQPVLVGTISIEKNEYLSKLLSREGIPHEVLNAKNHEQEAHIIAQAGRRGAVTVATNMAGRGVDIILGGNPASEQESTEICDMGGLHVIGTERHEARRIDNQLRGRSGRQGDHGSSQFFVSMEDDLMRIFGSDHMKPYITKLGIKEDEAIEHAFVSRALDSAQAKVEGLYFDVRKHVLEYDDVLSKQRQAFYRKRDEMLALTLDGAHSMMRTVVSQSVDRIVSFYNASGQTEADFIHSLGSLIKLPLDFTERIKGQHTDDVAGAIERVCLGMIGAREIEDTEQFVRAFRVNALRVFDTLWVDHLEMMEHLRDTANLRSYGQHDPLVEYRKEGYRMFRDLLDQIDFQLFAVIMRLAQRHHDAYQT